MKRFNSCNVHGKKQEDYRQEEGKSQNKRGTED